MAVTPMTFYDLLIRMGRRVIGVSYRRQRRLNRVLGYLPQRVVWWSGIVALTGLTLPLGDAWYLFFPVILVLMKGLARAGAKFPAITCFCWELILWSKPVGIVFAFMAIATDGVSDPTPGYFAITGVMWVITMYLFIDLWRPPRKRKRIKVPARMKSPIPAFQT